MSTIYKCVETTKWESPSTPNMIYYMSGGRLLGYQVEEGAPFRPFASKLFNTRGRTFKKTKVKQLPL